MKICTILLQFWTWFFFFHFAVGLMEDERNYNLICREKTLKQPLFIPHYRPKFWPEFEAKCCRWRRTFLFIFSSNILKIDQLFYSWNAWYHRFFTHSISPACGTRGFLLTISIPSTVRLSKIVEFSRRSYLPFCVLLNSYGALIWLFCTRYITYLLSRASFHSCLLTVSSRRPKELLSTSNQP